MIRRIALVILFLAVGKLSLEAQKKLIDHTTFLSWPRIQAQAISNDGRYVIYSKNSPNKETDLIIQATDRSWEKEFLGGSTAIFTSDSRRVILKIPGDSMMILRLGTDSARCFSRISGFAVVGEGRAIAYLKKADTAKALVFLDPATGEERQYLGINYYLFSNSGRVLLTTVNSSDEEGVQKQNIRWLNRRNDKLTTICRQCRASHFLFNEDGTKLVFLDKRKIDDQDVVILRYYMEGMDSAKEITAPGTPGMEGMIISDYLFLPKFGSRLFIKLMKPEELKDKEKDERSSIGAQVEIQGPNDSKLASELANGQFMAVIDLNNVEKGIVRLQEEADKGDAFYIDYSSNGNWGATLSNIVGNPNDNKWDISARPDLYLVSELDGSRRLLGRRLLSGGIQFSPTGKYFIWFDRQQRQWYCHDIAQGKTRDVTSVIKAPVDMEDDHPDVPLAPDVAGWLEGDKGILIYGRYDIWDVDPRGARPPIDLTRVDGAKNMIRFRCLRFNNNFSAPIRDVDTLLLSAFNTVTKEDGFYRLVVGARRLERLVMSSHIYNYQRDDFCGVHNPGRVMKAKDANVYFFARMSPTEYPNLYVTRDFRNIEQLTDLAPQQEYNWYTTELINYTLPDGNIGEGILFKPENFDPKKKYPVIFYYYEKNTFNLNIFIHPELTQGPMNIPWYVSNGYLVCVPDIYYKTGYPGRSACDAVVSAATYLSKKSWVDEKHMGLQGHSYGGFETNYIVSHSKLFVAAAPASGECDQISSYGLTEMSWFYERRQGRIGATLWQRPDLYIENSAIFEADKVTAAVLIEHTTDDGVCPYETQGLQWYNDLYRLRKKVWLLSYEAENHTLDNGKNRMDYDVRLAQFFDHYLKNKPAPIWMTRGVLSGKGMGDGLELDNSGKEP